MNLPIDVVVELLMAGAWNDVTYWAVMIPRPRAGLSPLRITADAESDLRSKVREYLLTLVPKPVLLSECEEGKDFYVRLDGRILPMRRVGTKAHHPLGVLNHWMPICPSDQCEVIQPVEVQR